MVQVELSAIVVAAGGFLISGMLAINVWFIKRLVAKLDSTSSEMAALKLQITTDMASMSTKIALLSQQIEFYKLILARNPELHLPAPQAAPQPLHGKVTT